MAIAEIAAGIFSGVVKPILDKFVVDADKRQEAELLFFRQVQEINLGQIEINKEEAKSSSLFVSGWRPFVGWVCAGTFAYAVVIRDILTWFLATLSMYSDKMYPALPAPDTTLTGEILFALLGFGSLRTYEKFKGVHS